MKPRPMDLIARLFDPASPPVLIAEAGVNHNGDRSLGIRLVETAAAAGADAVKFQSFRAESLAAPGAALAEYQREAGETGSDQLEMLARLELSEEDHRVLRDRAVELAIPFLSTPFDLESAQLLVNLGVPLIKMPSGEIDNLPYLERIAAFGLPLIVSTGMATLSEVEEAVRTIESRWDADGRKPGLVLLQCTSCYPARPEEMHLRAMETLSRAFGHPVGFSDHTEGIEVSLAAVALGARVIEKHFTMDRSLPGPDHQASLTPEELAALVGGIKKVRAALGSSVKRPETRELEVRDVARRSIVATEALPAGTQLTAEMLAARRPATGLSPRYTRWLIGRALSRDVAAGAQIGLGDLAPVDGADR